MRFFEFADTFTDELLTLLHTLQSMAIEKGTPAEYSWKALNNMLDSKIELTYQAFEPMFKSDEASYSNLIKNFSGKGVELVVPGASSDEPEQGDSDESQAAVNKIAASAAPNNL